MTSIERRYAIIDYMGTWNIGSYIVATNNFVLVGTGFRPQIIETIETTFSTKVIQQRIMGEDLVGCFVAANSYGILLPKETFDSEFQALKETLGDSYAVGKLNIKGTKNALGNLIATNDKKALISDTLYTQKIAQKIEDVLDVELVPIKIEISDVIASYVVFNNQGLIASPLLSDDEIDIIKNILGLSPSRVIVSTVNMGNPIVRSGLASNDKGVAVGNKTSGIELARIYNALIGQI